MAAVNQDELDALDDLKHTNDIITSSLTNDLQILRSRYKNLIIDYDQQRAHLVESLLDRENLRKDLEAARQRPKRTIDLILDGHEKNEKDDEEEKSKPALQSLKEVSPEHCSPKEKPSVAKTIKAFLSPRSKRRPENTQLAVPKGIEIIDAAELAQEQQEIGTLQREPKHVSSIKPNSPQPPPAIRCYNHNHELDRSRTKRTDQTNKYPSNRKGNK